MSSREIADLVESRHDSVKRTIERLAKQSVIGNPPMVDYKDSLGRTAAEYKAWHGFDLPEDARVTKIVAYDARVNTGTPHQDEIIKGANED